MLCPVTVYVCVYIYIFIFYFCLAQHFQVLKVSPSEKIQSKQLLYNLEKKIKLGVTDIVDLKSTFSEKALETLVETEMVTFKLLLF